MRRWILVVSLLGATACFPLRVSEVCRRQASDCLANCPTPPPNLADDRHFTNLGKDPRTVCEAWCHDQASSCTLK